MKIFKIISLLFVICGFSLILYEYALSKPYSLDAISMQLSSEVAEYGRVDIIKNLQKIVSNKTAKRSIESDLLYLKLRDSDSISLETLNKTPHKDRILCKIIAYKLSKSQKNLSTCFALLLNIDAKSIWYIKALYLIGIHSKNNIYIKKAVSIFQNLPVALLNTDIILDISKIALKNERYEDFILFVEKSPYSYRKIIIYYLSFSSDDCIKTIKKRVENKTLTPQGFSIFSRVLDCERFIKTEHKRFYFRMWRNTVYCYYGGEGKYWKVIEYNYPMLCYVTKISGLKKLSEEYLEKSLSSTTFECVKPNYINYVIYAQIALSEVGYNKQALALINRVSNPILKTKILKYTMKHIAKDPKLADNLYLELYNLYKTNTFNINYFL